MLAMTNTKSFLICTLQIGLLFVLTHIFTFVVFDTKIIGNQVTIIKPERTMKQSTEMQYEQLNIKIMTFNIFMFRNNNKNKNTSIQSVIRESESDIVLIQEDIFPLIRKSDGIIVDGYERVIECKTDPKKRHTIGNSILVSKRFLISNPIINTKSIDVTEGCPTRRCAAFVEFDNGLSIVNTHFCGGKYDDQHFASNKLVPDTIIDAKNNALRKILSTFGDVMFIGGDFNGMKNETLNQQLFQSYKLYQAMSDTNKKRFANFFHSPHVLLTEKGYYPTYNERMVNKTALIGPEINVPDWIYINSKTQYEIKEIKVFNTIKKPNDVSDHNAVRVTLNLVIDKHVFTDGYYIFHTNYDFSCVTAIEQQLEISHGVCNGTDLSMQTFFIKFNQKDNNNKDYFTVQSQQSKLYWTINVNCTDVQLCSNLLQHEYTGDDNQLFQFIYHTNHKYMIRVKQTGNNIAPSQNPAQIFQDGQALFTIYDYLNEKARISKMEAAITVEECVQNVPLIPKFIQNGIIDATNAIVFPKKVADEKSNFANENHLIDAVKFYVTGKQYNSSKAVAYHGAVDPNAYDGILLNDEGLKGQKAGIYKKLRNAHNSEIELSDIVVFLTPSWKLARLYGTCYVFQEYIYSLILEVEVDINKMISIWENSCPACLHIDENISDDKIEWIYHEQDIQITAIIVTKHRKELLDKQLPVKSFHSRWRRDKLKHVEAYV